MFFTQIVFQIQTREKEILLNRVASFRSAFIHIVVYLNCLLYTSTGISVVYGAFSACVQIDLKYINAYSSVSHGGLVFFAILMLNQTAATGAILQMLSHGLMTALFFALIGMIYGRTHTRDVLSLIHI